MPNLRQQRHRSAKASLLNRQRPPPRPSPLPRLRKRSSAVAPDGGRGDSATANSEGRFTKRKNRPVTPGGFCLGKNRRQSLQIAADQLLHVPLPLIKCDTLASVTAGVARELTLERCREREAALPFYFGGRGR